MSTLVPHDRRIGYAPPDPETDAAFRRQLARDAIWHRIVSPGDRLPSLHLLEADLGPIYLDRLRLTGPVVLVFFRHADSVECNATLRTYQETLAPALTDLSAHLVAVSPQSPELLEPLKRRHDLDFFVATDVRHRLIDAFNIGFTSPGTQRVLGVRDPVLPFPAVVVADRSGVVRLADVQADWARRTDARTIVEAVRGR